MVHQLLWVEVLLKAATGIIIFFAPIATARALGLPHGNITFWPRVTGIVLISLAAAIYLEGLRLQGTYLTTLNHGGLGLAGVAAINAVAALLLAIATVTGELKTIRGRLSVWFCVALLSVLAFFEIIHAQNVTV